MRRGLDFHACVVLVLLLAACAKSAQSPADATGAGGTGLSGGTAGTGRLPAGSPGLAAIRGAITAAMDGTADAPSGGATGAFGGAGGDDGVAQLSGAGTAGASNLDAATLDVGSAGTGASGVAGTDAGGAAGTDAGGVARTDAGGAAADAGSAGTDAGGGSAGTDAGGAGSGGSEIENVFEATFDDLTGWTDGSAGWDIDHAPNSDPPSGSGDPFAHCDDCKGEGCWLETTDAIDLSSYSAATLSFLRFIDSDVDANEYLAVQVFHQAAWLLVAVWPGGDDAWHEERIDLTLVSGFDFSLATDFRIRFEAHTSEGNEDIYLDDVRVTAVR